MNPGDILKNQYRIVRQLGSGGFGVTFLAEDTYLPSNRQCAVKEITPPTSNSSQQTAPPIVAWFYQEAKNLEALGQSCEQIPKLYAFFEDGGKFYLVQEFIEGKTLAQLVSAHGAFNEEQTKDFLTHFLPILDYTHAQGVIHRDIKPSNIIVRSADGKPVMIDFGAVKELATVALYPQGNLLTTLLPFTLGYTAPEQLLGQQPVFASDIYSLGMTAIHLLTRESPHALTTPDGNVDWKRHVKTSVTPEFTAVIDKSVHYKYQDRYQTAQEMLVALLSSTDSATTAQRITPKTKQDPKNKDGAVNPGMRSKKGTSPTPDKYGQEEPSVDGFFLPLCVGLFGGAISGAALEWGIRGVIFLFELQIEPPPKVPPISGRCSTHLFMT